MPSFVLTLHERGIIHGDIKFALRIAVWELFTSKKAFEDLDKDGWEEMKLTGRKVYVEGVEPDEVREFTRESLNMFEK